MEPTGSPPPAGSDTHETTFQRENRLQSGVYAKRELTIVSGKGAKVRDEDGREYIDCVAGISVANLGHCHPKIVRAITEQAQRLITCQEMFANDVRADYLERLVGVAPGKLERVFLCNSGTEAIEAAIKFAFVVTKRHKVVAAMRGFHGRTLGALSATWEKKYREPFLPLVPDFTHVPYNDLEKLDAAVDDTVAAVLLEPVQGEGGIRPGDPDYLRAAQKLCRERGAMFLLDEIQTAFGRTGTLFAAEHAGLDPDMLCIAKSMAGGVPMGATLLGPRVVGLPPKIHGSTFGGNPLACAAGIAALDAIRDENLCERANELGKRAAERLEAHGVERIREIRQLGLMIGVELRDKAAPVLPKLQEKGVLALLGGVNVLRLLPPLVIEQDDLDAAIDIIADVLSQPTEAPAAAPPADAATGGRAS